jgi:hypothetical protein
MLQSRATAWRASPSRGNTVFESCHIPEQRQLLAAAAGLVTIGAIPVALIGGETISLNVTIENNCSQECRTVDVILSVNAVMGNKDDSPAGRGLFERLHRARQTGDYFALRRNAGNRAAGRMLRGARRKAALPEASGPRRSGDLSNDFTIYPEGGASSAATLSGGAGYDRAQLDIEDGTAGIDGIIRNRARAKVDTARIRRYDSRRVRTHVPVAQLDRASASEAEGYRFDPYRERFSHQ